MAYVHHYDHAFDGPLSKRARRREPAQVFRSREHSDLIDLEFSNVGRNPRFPAGWFILPAIMSGVAILTAVALLA